MLHTACTVNGVCSTSHGKNSLHDLTRAKNAQFHNALPYPLVPSAYQRLRLAAGAAVGVRVLCPEASLLTVMPAAARTVGVLLGAFSWYSSASPFISNSGS